MENLITISAYEIISIFTCGMLFYVVINLLDEFMPKLIKWIYLKIKGLFKKKDKEHKNKNDN